MNHVQPDWAATSTAELLDRLRIEELIARLGRCLDERDFEAIRELFTADGRVTTPGGVATGCDAIVEQARRRHSADVGIQHVITNALIDIAGDRADVRANLLVTFARDGVGDPRPFQLGEVYRFRLRQADNGWRFESLISSPVWSLNAPAAAPA
jgi:hypothetical protein